VVRAPRKGDVGQNPTQMTADWQPGDYLNGVVVLHCPIMDSYGFFGRSKMGSNGRHRSLRSSENERKKGSGHERRLYGSDLLFANKGLEEKL